MVLVVTSDVDVKYDRKYLTRVLRMQRVVKKEISCKMLVRPLPKRDAGRIHRLVQCPLLLSYNDCAQKAKQKVCLDIQTASRLASTTVLQHRQRE